MKLVSCALIVSEGTPGGASSYGGSGVRRGTSGSEQPMEKVQAMDLRTVQNLFHIDTSELQLMEETERDGNASGGKETLRTEERWRIDAIGVKGFKLLEMLRVLGKNGSGTITTVSLALYR